jgi:MotA/TolQ/ExbB proton channel family
MTQAILRWALKPDLGLTKTGWVACVALSVLVSCWFYADRQQAWRDDALAAVKSADVIKAFCSRSATLNQAQCAKRAKAPLLDPLGVWLLLRDAGLLDPDVVPSHADLKSEQTSVSVRALAQYFEKDASIDPNMPGLTLLYDVGYPCKAGEVSVDNRSIARAENTHRIAKDLAWGLPVAPNGIEQWTPLDDFTLVLPSAKPDAEIVTEILADAGVFGTAKDLQVRDAGACTSVQDVLGGLGQEADRAIDDILAARAALALWVAGEIRQSDDLSRARTTAALWTGYEQLALMMVFAFAALVMILRSLSTALAYFAGAATPGPTQPGEDIVPPQPGVGWRHWYITRLGRQVFTGDHISPAPPLQGRSVAGASWDQQRLILSRIVISARWPVSTAMLLLPALGFIGTVRGIMNSLTGADALVFAATENERAAAIGALAGDLGLAFATTLIALVCSGVLTIAMAIEMRLVDKILLRRLADLATSGREGAGARQDG